MITSSFMQVFCSVLVLTIVMAFVAFVMSRKRGQMGNVLIESGVWGFSLIACAGADYLLMVLCSNHVWGGA